MLLMKTENMGPYACFVWLICAISPPRRANLLRNFPISHSSLHHNCDNAMAIQFKRENVWLLAWVEDD